MSQQQRPAVEFQSWVPKKENDQHQKKMKKQTYVGDHVLPEFVRRKILFGDLVSELEWEYQPCRKINREIADMAESAFTTARDH